MTRNIFVAIVMLTIIGGALAGSKKSDAWILTRVGQVVGEKVVAILPAKQELAGPLNALQTSTMLTAQERVRVRLKTEKSLEGIAIDVVGEEGEVRLRGRVADATQRQRAIELAQSTQGVTNVISELAEPVAK